MRTAIKCFYRIMADDSWAERMKAVREDPAVPLSSSTLLQICSLFVVSVIVRAILLFLLTHPGYTGWYGDVYHHWQIAYYTLHVGLSQNPPRMWDLNGMEYYWGMLPVLIQVFLLWVLNTASLVPFQVFNLLMGSVTPCLIYLICEKWFARKVGLVGGFLVAVNPVIAISDISGMYEPIGILLLLAAVYFYDTKPFLTGVLSAMAAMCRIEYLFLSVAIFACYLVFERSGIKFVPGFLGWLTASVPHFLWIQMGTGDWLYQLRWNIVSAQGGWDPRYNLPQYQQMLILPRSVATILLIISSISLLVLLWKRPRGYALPVLFLAYSSFQFAAFSLTSYLAIILFTPLERFVIDRMFSLDYMFASWLIAMALESFPFSFEREKRFEADRQELRERFSSGEVSEEEYLRKLERLESRIRKDQQASGISTSRISVRRFRLGRPVKIGIFIALLVTSLGGFLPVVAKYDEGLSGYYSSEKTAQDLLVHYDGGTIISANVFLNYHMINTGIPYDKIVGSLYSPRYYGTYSLKASLTWLKDLNASWIFVDSRIYEEFPVLKDDETHPPFYVVLPRVLYQVNQTELSAQLAQM